MMKIQCDVCGKQGASIFCSADEAALCDGCDHRVHHANKLASKHPRFSLLFPSSSGSGLPLCDICKEKKALFFCQQDRAILCKDCDFTVHSANELTQKHCRFVLTGIKLSLIASPPPSTTKTATPVAATPVPNKVPDCGGCFFVPDFKKPIALESQLVSAPCLNSRPIATNNIIVTNNDANSLLITDDGGWTSSISEYLMEMLPGWKVDEFLDCAAAAAPFGLSKGADDGDLESFWDHELDKNGTVGGSGKMGICIPQTPVLPQQAPFGTNGGVLHGLGGEKAESGRRVSSGKWMDDGFTVPEINPQTVGSRSFRTYW